MIVFFSVLSCFIFVEIANKTIKKVQRNWFYIGVKYNLYLYKYLYLPQRLLPLLAALFYINQYCIYICIYVYLTIKAFIIAVSSRLARLSPIIPSVGKANK